MRKYNVTRKRQVTIALSGTSGTANININGTNYLATFASTLTVTADNFRTTHAANVLSQQAVVATDNDAGSVVLRANVSGKNFTATITNVSGDLAGVVTENKAQSNFELFTSALVGAGGGNISVFQIKDRDSGALVVEAEKIKKLNYHEGELIDIATASDFTLVSMDGDGANSVSKRAEA